MARDEITVGDRRLFSVEKMAEELGYSVFHLRNYARLGKLPGARKIGRRWYFDIEVFMAQHKEHGENSNPLAKETPEDDDLRDL